LSIPIFQIASMLNSIGLPNLGAGRASKRSPIAAMVAFCVRGLSGSTSAGIGKLTMDEMDTLTRTSGPNLKRALLQMFANYAKHRTVEKRPKAWMPRDVKSSNVTKICETLQRWADDACRLVSPHRKSLLIWWGAFKLIVSQMAVGESLMDYVFPVPR
jgi:hypothetical protein